LAGFHALTENAGLAGLRFAQRRLSAVLIGFGGEGGHRAVDTWLPAAIRVAPSNVVPRFLSGVIIKNRIYGMARGFFYFLGKSAMWWGVTVLTIGTVSAVLALIGIAPDATTTSSGCWPITASRTSAKSPDGFSAHR